MQTQASTNDLDSAVQHYIARGGIVTRGKTRRAQGIAYFALTLKKSKHLSKINYMRNKRTF